MCSDNGTEKSLETHELIVGISWEICSMVAPSFYVAIVVLYGDVENLLFRITLITFVKFLTRYLCGGLDFITTGINEI